MKKLSLLLLVLLAACTPSARYLPPDTPIVYPVAYRTLFDTVLQELTAAYVPAQLDRRTFSITQADPETGLITAVRNEPGTTARLSYRYPPVDDDDRFYGLGLQFLVPVPVTPREQTTITVVVRPQGEGASLIYSTQGPNGTSSAEAERLMRGIVARLDARFLTPVEAGEGVLEPLEPVTP